jgi:hypothetical protein
LDQTFFFSSILFFITGMGFGTSYSLVHVDCLDWVHSEFYLRIIRGVLGCLISGSVFVAFQLIPCNDNPTRFFFLYALPALSLSFFVFGIFPILCQKIGLVRATGVPKVMDVDNIKSVKRSIAQGLDETLSEKGDSEDKKSISKRK